MMHEGKIGPQVRPADVQRDRPMIAVGALSDLRGEITILGDRAVLSFGMADGSTRTSTDLRSESAALLVAAPLPRWRSVPIAHVIAADRFDDEVEAILKQSNLSAGRVPVVIRGTFIDVRWHVLAGTGSGRPPHADVGHHPGASIPGQNERIEGVLVGFYSPADQGVFTHHGRRTHFHLMPSNNEMTAHVDAAGIAAGAIVQIPDRFD